MKALKNDLPRSVWSRKGGTQCNCARWEMQPFCVTSSHASIGDERMFAGAFADGHSDHLPRWTLCPRRALAAAELRQASEACRGCLLARNIQVLWAIAIPKKRTSIGSRCIRCARSVLCCQATWVSRVWLAEMLGAQPSDGKHTNGRRPATGRSPRATVSAERRTENRQRGFWNCASSQGWVNLNSLLLHLHSQAFCHFSSNQTRHPDSAATPSHDIPRVAQFCHDCPSELSELR